jgi:predicted branched-subunit amino acid permease
MVVSASTDAWGRGQACLAFFLMAPISPFSWLQLWRNPALRLHLLEGVRAVIPGVVSTLIWGLVAGVAIGKAELSLDVQLGIIMLVYSGTAQLAALPMVQAGAALSAIAITALLVSLRFVLYSGLVERYFHFLPKGQRLLLGFFTIDSGLAAFSAQDVSQWSQQRQFAFFAGCNLPVWLAWTIGSLTGLACAQFLPSGPEWAFMARLAMMALLVPLLVLPVQWLTAAVGGGLAVALATAGLDLLQLPIGIGMVISVMCGAACAVLLVRRERPQ